MVSSALVRRFLRLLLIVTIASSVVLVALRFLLCGDAKRCSGREHRDGEGDVTCQITKPYTPPAAEEFEAYLRIMQDVVNAYSNCQIEAMFEEARRLPSKAYKLKGEYRLKLERPISQIWRDVWVLNTGFKEFASEKEFGRQMKKSLAVAKLYGEFMVSTGAVANEILVTIDWIALKRLQTFRDEFKRDGKTGCLQTAEYLLANWIRQIESEKGFTRAYMRAQKIGLGHFVKTGELPEEKLVQYVRDYVRPLQEYCGYTPKWLDEEFPVTPSE